MNWRLIPWIVKGQRAPRPPVSWLPRNGAVMGKSPARLTASDYRVIAPWCVAPPTAVPSGCLYAMATLGQDEVVFIDAFGEISAIVVSHDWGGFTGLQRSSVAAVKDHAAHGLGRASSARLADRGSESIYVIGFRSERLLSGSEAGVLTDRSGSAA